MVRLLFISAQSRRHWNLNIIIDESHMARQEPANFLSIETLNSCCHSRNNAVSRVSVAISQFSWRQKPTYSNFLSKIRIDQRLHLSWMHSEVPVWRTKQGKQSVSETRWGQGDLCRVGWTWLNVSIGTLHRQLRAIYKARGNQHR